MGQSCTGDQPAGLQIGYLHIPNGSGTPPTLVYLSITSGGLLVAYVDLRLDIQALIAC